jgi:hypothetical protein
VSAIRRETRKPVPRQHTFKLELSDAEVVALHFVVSNGAQTGVIEHFCRVLSEAVREIERSSSPPSTHTSDGSPAEDSK